VVNRLTKWINIARSVKQDWKVPRNAINLSTQSLHIQGFPAFVRRHIEVAKLPPETFCFELIWEDAVEHAEALLRAVAELKPIGCRFTIARFDGVPGSFEMLRILAPDFVKISPRIVLALGQGQTAAAEEIQGQCAHAGIRTIAEYVESDAVLAELRRIGVHHAQGFAIQPPQLLA
jgi:EAL domain-containing protein (putative c-di-GMP-specific phosphodiesterase class I)